VPAGNLAPIHLGITALLGLLAVGWLQQESASLPGIAVSESIYLQTMAIQSFEAHKVVLKGIGETAAYAARLDEREGED